MTQNEKDLLLKDLCARLPYGVKCKVDDFPTHGLGGDNDKNVWSIASIIYYPPESEHHETVHTIHYYPDGRVMHVYPQIDRIKPYLFPMSSMTEEQKRDYQYITERWMNNPAYSISDSFDWLNTNHFDYRGLIEKSLALDATGLGIY